MRSHAIDGWYGRVRKQQALSQVALIAHTVHISNTRRTRPDTAPSTHICASSARLLASTSLCRARVSYKRALRWRTCGLHSLEVLGKDEKHHIRSAESSSACSRPARRRDVGTQAVRPHQHGTRGTCACPVYSPRAASSSAPAARRRASLARTAAAALLASTPAQCSAPFVSSPRDCVAPPQTLYFSESSFQGASFCAARFSPRVFAPLSIFKVPKKRKK